MPTNSLRSTRGKVEEFKSFHEKSFLVFVEIVEREFLIVFPGSFLTRNSFYLAADKALGLALAANKPR